ncbi:MAG: phage virion morphogenesis protein [Gammaproteobacteria bacterium]|nr:phage virion morphogenesis protein [Gammaproteobacteria bacterium]
MAAQFKVIGMEKFNKFITDNIRLLKFPSRFFARSGVIGLADVMRHFRSTQSDTGKWKAVNRGGQPLQKTGRLKNSISFVYDNKGAVVGTNVVYAATHNYGDKRRNIEQRKFLWLSKNAEEKIEKAYIDLVKRG